MVKAKIKSQPQSILFHKTYWTTIQARQYLRKWDLDPIKRVHITKNYLRYRLQKPGKYLWFSTIDLDKKGTVKSVLGYY